MIEPSEVLEFWFGDRSAEPDAATKKKWWTKNPDFDATVRERFGAAITKACAGELDGWADSAEGALALVLVLDQFTRNAHRDKPEMYSGDEKAAEVACRALDRGDGAKLRQCEREFLYMPLMHAEDLALQERCVALFESEGGEAKYAKMHRDIVARFGRFPHRNEILSRETTSEEHEFLKEPGSSF